MTMIVICVRKVNYFPVVRITVCCPVCYMLSEALWCKRVLVFAAVVHKREKAEVLQVQENTDILAIKPISSISDTLLACE